MNSGIAIDAALASAWHTQSALSSLQRWLEVCEQEEWGSVPDNLPLLGGVFGASWYFTRFIFYRGRQTAGLIDKSALFDCSLNAINKELAAALDASDQEQQLEQLRILKNESMLQILVCYLNGRFDQAEAELALTNLAEATLDCAMRIFDLFSSPRHRIAALGMGRMAGKEMIFGSDLDLIFLYEHESDESSLQLSKKIRLLLRHLSSAASGGTLYDVDMRLRPHGTSGALLTSVDSFLEYHRQEREIWERQMMTRCRPVIDKEGMGQTALQEIMPCIYTEYDETRLRNEVVSMRRRVQMEKGNLSGKFEVKRGRGGLMDIDFITHFLQLRHGCYDPALQTASTRRALALLAEKTVIPADTAASLLDAYDFLKRVESSVRLFDMKPISDFSKDPADHLFLARAMGFHGDNTNGFLEAYQTVAESVRHHFDGILGEPAGYNDAD
ncbi:MAG: hypothetical protein ACE5GZ_08785 [Gammaproteobacteria bacterium]